MRAPRRSRVAGAHAAAVGLGDRADDRQAEPGPPAARARAGSSGESARISLALRSAGIPGPSSSTANRILSGASRSTSSRTRPVPAVGVRDRVARQVAQRLGEAVGIGLRLPSGTGPSSKRRSAVRLTPSHRSSTKGCSSNARHAGSRSARTGRAEQVVDEPADARDLGLHQPLDAAHLVAGRVLLRGQHLELATDHGQRGTQLVRGVGDELTLARERLREPVEHVVERVGEDPDLAPLPAAVSIRGSRSPASTRAATAAIRRSGAVTLAPARYEATARARARSRPRAGTPGRRRAGRARPRQRLAGTDDHARLPWPGHARSRIRTRPTSGTRWVEYPSRGTSSSPERSSRCCSLRRLAVLRRARRTPRDGC